MKLAYFSILSLIAYAGAIQAQTIAYEYAVSSSDAANAGSSLLASWTLDKCDYQVVTTPSL